MFEVLVEDDVCVVGVVIVVVLLLVVVVLVVFVSSDWLRGFLSAPAAQGISVTLPAAAAASVAAQPASLAASRPYWDGLGIAPQKAAPQAPGRSANWLTAFVTNLARPVAASPNASLRITLL